jgi:hypothetical protein
MIPVALQPTLPGWAAQGWQLPLNAAFSSWMHNSLHSQKGLRGSKQVGYTNLYRSL